MEPQPDDRGPAGVVHRGSGLIGRIKVWFLRRIAVHGPVQVGKRFHVGPFSRVWAPRNLVIGDDVYIGKHATIEVDGSIGSYTIIANNVGIVGRRDHDMRQAGRPMRLTRWVGTAADRLSLETTIGSDVWIGFGSIVLSGVTVGASAVIGAGAVVVKDVAPGVIVVGNPARPIATRFESMGDLLRHWTNAGISPTEAERRQAEQSYLVLGRSGEIP